MLKQPSNCKGKNDLSHVGGHTHLKKANFETEPGGGKAKANFDFKGGPFSFLVKVRLQLETAVSSKLQNLRLKLEIKTYMFSPPAPIFQP